MGIIKSWVIFSRESLIASLFASLLLLSSLLSLLISPLANAASDYDDTINLIDNAVLKRGGDTRDVLFDYATLLNDCDNWQASIAINCPTFNDIRSEALENGSGWSVSMVDLQNDTSIGDQNFMYGDRVLRFVVSTNPMLEGRFSQSVPDGINTYKTLKAFSPSSDIAEAFVILKTDGDIQVVGSNNANNVTVATNLSVPFTMYQPLFINYPIDYPDGYDGEIPPDEPDIKTTVFPHFGYQVDDKKITAVYNKNIATTESCSTVHWLIARVDDGAVNEDTIQVFQLPPDEPFQFTVGTYSPYVIAIMDVTKPIPCAPLPDDIVVGQTTMQITTNGSSFSGNTDSSDCENTSSEAQFCNEVSPYEDCSVYGVDLIAGFGCIIGNFGTFLRIMLTSLFVPRANFFSNFFEDLTQFFTQKLGFIAYPIVAVITFFQDIYDGASTSVCTIGSGTMFGAPLVIDLCLLEDSIGNIYDQIITIIRASVCFLMMFALYRKYHEVIRGDTQ